MAITHAVRQRASMPLACNFTPGGRTHKILANLAHREGNFRRIADAVGLADPIPANRRKKLWSLITELERSGLIGRDGKVFHLLPRGETELARLNQVLGHEPRLPRPVPSVRYFTPHEADAHG